MKFKLKVKKCKSNKNVILSEKKKCRWRLWHLLANLIQKTLKPIFLSFFLCYLFFFLFLSHPSYLSFCVMFLCFFVSISSFLSFFLCYLFWVFCFYLILLIFLSVLCFYVFLFLSHPSYLSFPFSCFGQLTIIWQTN